MRIFEIATWSLDYVGSIYTKRRELVELELMRTRRQLIRGCLLQRMRSHMRVLTQRMALTREDNGTIVHEITSCWKI